MSTNTRAAPMPVETTRMHRNVLLLAACQALYMTGTSTVLTVTAIAGARIAPTPLLATLPFSLQFIATMATTIPASLLMRRIGRRRGFLIGSAAGMIGASLAALGLVSATFALFALGSMVIGVLNGFAVFYRFAAADAADERHPQHCNRGACRRQDGRSDLSSALPDARFDRTIMRCRPFR